MQHERPWYLISQRGANGVDVLGAFGQRQHLAALPEGVDDRAGDGCRAGRVLCQMPEHILDARLQWQSDRRLDELRHHRQIVRRLKRLRRLEPDRPALHEDDGLLPVAANRRCRQADHVFCVMSAAI